MCSMYWARGYWWEESKVWVRCDQTKARTTFIGTRSTLKNSEISTDKEFVPNPDLRWSTPIFEVDLKMTLDLRGKRRPATNEQRERNKRVKKTEERDLGKVGSKKVVAHFTIFYYKKRKISLFPIMTQGSHLEGERERNLVGRKNVTQEVMLYQSGENVSLIFSHSLLYSHLEILIVEQIHYMWWSLSLAHTGWSLVWGCCHSSCRCSGCEFLLYPE